MNKVTLLVPAPHCRIDVIKATTLDKPSVLRYWWDTDSESNYVDAGSFYTKEFGEMAAQDAFDLTNNPSRHNDRLLVQGHNDHFGVGSVVKLEVKSSTGCISTAHYLCLNVGWEVL